MKEVSQELQQGEWRDKKILDFECWIGTDVEFWMVDCAEGAVASNW